MNSRRIKYIALS